MKKNLLLYLFVIISLILIVGCSEQNSKQKQIADENILPAEKINIESNFLTYENAEYGIKIDYPAEWEMKEPENVIVAFVSPKSNASDSFQENFNLIMNDLSGQNITLDKYNEIVLAQLKQTFPEINIEKSNPIILSNGDAYKIEYTIPNSKIMQIFTIQNDISYIFTYVAEKNKYSNYLGLIQKMLDSFEITKNIKKQAENKSVEKINDSVEKIKIETSINTDDSNSAFIGIWKIYSERIFYDIGGSGATTAPVTRTLELLKDGSWTFGNSKGSWSVTEITNEDWNKWGIDSYGPKRKMVFDKWNNAFSIGPIEETDNTIDFIWVIYHVEPPVVQNAGTIWIKFGHN